MAATLRVRFTTDDASDATPTWTDVTDQVRSFQISAGRDSELGLVDAGTATIVVNNRTQSFDPTDDPTIRPLNRWEITEMITGEVQFVGYARSYTQQWPAPGVDAVTVVDCVDEMMVLSLDRLPVMDPPSAQTYSDVVLFDEPTGYWKPTYPSGTGTSYFLIQGDVGGVDFGLGPGSFTKVVGAIVGDVYPTSNETLAPLTGFSTTGSIKTANSDHSNYGLEANGPGDVAGINTMTFEMWFKSSEATPAAQRQLVLGPRTDSGATAQWGIFLLTNGKIRASAVNAAGTQYDADSNSAISADTWYHVAMTVQASFTSLYINGVLQTPQAAFSSTFDVADAGAFMEIGTPTAVGGTRYYDEIAFYRYTLETSRILAHYQAGALRGYLAEDTDDRADAIMADSASVAPFDFTSIGREMIPTFQYGQSPLEELRRCEQAEQGFLFVAKDGTVTMLLSGYQGVSPYNVVQATFDDDGTDLKYRDVEVDYSSTFLFNEVTVSREGGLTWVESDATSISAFLRRPLIIPALPITSDGDAAAIAANLLAKYKDPMNRITRLTVDTSDQDVADAVLPLDLGDRVQVNVTQPNGGRISQELHVQKREISGAPGKPWIISLGLSPL